MEVVRTLAEAGADLNQTTTSGATPLFIDAQKGEVEVMNTMVEAGADPNHAMTHGK